MEAKQIYPGVRFSSSLHNYRRMSSFKLENLLSSILEIPNEEHILDSDLGKLIISQ